MHLALCHILLWNTLKGVTVRLQCPAGMSFRANLAGPYALERLSDSVKHASASQIRTGNIIYALTREKYHSSPLNRIQELNQTVV